MCDDELPADLGLDQACDRDPRAAQLRNRARKQADADTLADQIDQRLDIGDVDAVRRGWLRPQCGYPTSAPMRWPWVGQRWRVIA
jgi:hypothetical protein